MLGQEYQILKDEEIWEIFKSGNQEALSYIFKCNIKILYKYGNKFSSNGQMVEDCIQDLFLTIWKNRLNLSSTNSIKLYLLGALRKKLIRQSAVDQKHHTQDLLDEKYSFDLQYNPQEIEFNLQARLSNEKQVTAFLDKLTKRQKEAVYLKFYQDMDYKEIAHIMELNYQSVRNLVYSSLKALKSQLSRYSI
ncbi:sigma-70 family RNA polymerase sigma factor [Reichenbachiella sp. MALMAid0571]|uniref:RNA polymerase sigma factor n=1 Tax=Reichenbachiella sp. MALMAid0571 TaxID=3143939 RepID=UPI0032E00AF6